MGIHDSFASQGAAQIIERIPCWIVFSQLVISTAYLLDFKSTKASCFQNYAAFVGLFFQKCKTAFTKAVNFSQEGRMSALRNSCSFIMVWPIIQWSQVHPSIILELVSSTFYFTYKTSDKNLQKQMLTCVFEFRAALARHIPDNLKFSKNSFVYSNSTRTSWSPTVSPALKWIFFTCYEADTHLQHAGFLREKQCTSIPFESHRRLDCSASSLLQSHRPSYRLRRNLRPWRSPI